MFAQMVQSFFLIYDCTQGALLQEQKLLVSLGLDGGSPKIKVWSLKDHNGGIKPPPLLRTFDVFAAKSDITGITQLAVHPAKSQLVYALGQVSGSILVLKADTGRPHKAFRRQSPTCN